MKRTYLSFVGIHGETVTVKRSAAPGDPRVWLVADRGGDNNGALHLTPEQCRDVIKALESFVADAAVKRPQTWRAGDPEPEGVARVRDNLGRTWYPFEGGWRHGLMNAFATTRWKELLERYGPVVGTEETI